MRIPRVRNKSDVIGFVRDEIWFEAWRNIDLLFTSNELLFQETRKRYWKLGKYIALLLWNKTNYRIFGYRIQRLVKFFEHLPRNSFMNIQCIFTFLLIQLKKRKLHWNSFHLPNITMNILIWMFHMFLRVTRDAIRILYANPQSANKTRLSRL